MGEVQLTPGVRTINTLEPEPSGAQGDASVLQVAYPQATEEGGATHPIPVHSALPSTRILAANPKEASNDPVDSSKDGLVDGNGDEDVDGHGAEDVPTEREAIPQGEHGSQPGRELPLKLVDEG